MRYSSLFSYGLAWLKKNSSPVTLARISDMPTSMN
jgi:hypothetical protein